MHNEEHHNFLLFLLEYIRAVESSRIDGQYRWRRGEINLKYFQKIGREETHLGDLSWRITLKWI
jgi:hypothetical protein